MRLKMSNAQRHNAASRAAVDLELNMHLED
jgi:hypothetical protein